MGKHKNTTISFRPSEWQKTEIETRARLSGMPKNEFICKSCVYGKIVVVGKKENVQLIVDELQDMKCTLKEIADQLLDGKMVLSEEGFSEMEKAYLALIITVVEIINGAAYLFEDN